MILDLFKKKTSPLDAAALAVLEQAIAQRAKMDIEFEEGVTGIKGLSCVLTSLAGGALRLDVYGISRPGNFTGHSFDCYFRIREGRMGTGFYTFSTTVQQVRQLKHGGIEFLAAMPVKLARSQRRRSVRVRPDLSWFEELAIHKGPPGAQDDPASLLASLATLGAGRGCRLVNLSAGGLGLHFERQFCLESGYVPALGGECTVHLRFVEEVRNQPKDVWLTGRVARAEEDPVSRDVDAGLEFTQVGLRPGPEEPVRWKPVAENVVEEIIHRLFELHAAMCRERAAAE